MSKFTNLQSFVEPNTTLFPQEVDVIQAIIRETLAFLGEQPTQGTFILDGQKTGEDAKCILRFNLEDGPGVWQIGTNGCATTDALAERAINGILSWPKRTPYPWPDGHRRSSQFSSKVHHRSELRVLVLNTTYGRFLASCCFGFSENRQNRNVAILNAVAETFAQMGKEDKGLQNSVQQTRAWATSLDKDVIQLVQQLFKECTLLELETWRNWHEPANGSGDLTLFFE